MTRARAVALAAAASCLAVAMLARRPAPAPDPEGPAPAEGLAPAASSEVVHIPPPPAAPPAPEPAEVVAYRARAARVARSCGLGAVTRCRDGACVAALTMPDLDRLGGWVRLGFSSPRFVLSTVARDLGVPPRILPCGTAVAELVGEGTVRTVELPDGDEVWCAVEGEPEQANTLCDTLAEERAGARAARFSEPGLRQLSFDR
jgi:hypothetical protein